MQNSSTAFYPDSTQIRHQNFAAIQQGQDMLREGGPLAALPAGKGRPFRDGSSRVMTARHWLRSTGVTPRSFRALA
ncbi:hypothetical protein FJ950_19145 [Mesorhizobium sp. B2-3-14]|nr:hypothetical protein FJ950_19145 [Mesorhizobium sp. B2-3-14]